MPQSLRWAAWLAFVHAAVILANATIGQVLGDWADPGDYALTFSRPPS